MDQEMRYVLEVYRQKSFSRAAEKLFVTQPALSIAIRKLEASLGTTLFDRRVQPLRLTPAGEVYVRQAMQMMSLMNDLEAEINDLSQLKRGRLRIGGTHYFNAYVLPPVLDAFNKRYPGIEISLREASSERINHELAESRIDVMFSAVDFDERRFHKEAVFSDQIVLAVPNRLCQEAIFAPYRLSRHQLEANVHLQRDCPVISLTQFEALPFLLLTEGNNLHHRSLHMCREAGFEPQALLMLEQFSTAYALSCAGLGISFASTLIIRKSPDAPVSYFKIDSPLAYRSFNAITRKRSYRPQAVDAFLQLLGECHKESCPI